ncbi:hypothetical protein [Azospirillum palustre]
MTIDDSDLDRNRPLRSPSDSPMGRIVEMAFSGLWVIRQRGVLAEIGGRLYWSDRASLEQAAARAGIPLSADVVHTGRLDTDCLDPGRR